MSEPRPQGRLLFVALLLVAQTLLAWHAPAHIFDGHDGHSAATTTMQRAWHIFLISPAAKRTFHRQTDRRMH